jgi:parallel beta-helix repeat protein
MHLWIHMDKRIRNIFLCILAIFCIPSIATARVITSDALWEGDVLISEDILVPEGITLTIKPGTKVSVAPTESTRTDPEYMSPLTEITVRGTLNAEGTKKSPIVFILTKNDKSTGWAGIIIDGGTAHLRSCSIQHAETGISVITGRLDLEDAVISENRYGLVANGEGTKVHMQDTQIKNNDHGLFSLRGAEVESSNSVVRDNMKKDSYVYKGNDYPLEKLYVSERRDMSRWYGNEVLQGETIWQGRIEIDGIIRVPEGGRLIVLPGTVVEFKKHDTNGDGIGENGLLIQGFFIAKGTAEHPIFFRSAETHKKMADWDAINIMNSDGAQNLIEYCQIEDAYRGIHFHFSNVAVKASVLRNNYRGIQFQESLAEISRNYIYGNKSGMQARDSKVVETDNYICNNYYGANFFRVNLVARNNKILSNLGEGIRIREGEPTVEENLINGNRYGLFVLDAFYGGFNRNVITNNAESGISLKDDDNLEISGNYLQGNGFHGINIQDSRATIRGNSISGNGERGIKMVSFDGTITENNFIKNGIYAIGIDGEEVFDKTDIYSQSGLQYEDVSKSPIQYVWPLETVATDTVWYGDMSVQFDIVVLPGATLMIAPGAKIACAQGIGLTVNGKIMAAGRKDERIIFTNAEKTEDAEGYWNEMLIEHANGSILSHCTFEHATWGVHSHFTNLKVEHCQFSNNYGGLRFRSGPIEITRSLFKDNSVGLRAYRGIASISENIITGNEIGIFVREKGGELRIRKNNIFDNTRYNIRIGDFNDEDVDAAENWWGEGEPEDTIFDGRKEPSIGKVLYEPYLRSPLSIDVNGGKL